MVYRKRSIALDMKKNLPRDLYKTLEFIGRLADSNDSRAYIVGGFVRDLLLGEKNLDVDIVAEPDGIKFAEILAGELKAKLVTHKRFGTATISTKRYKRIDIATARTERYKRPGALPSVKSSSIKKDLSRRDFTINAVAASLNPGSFGALIDFCGGCRDIKNGVIKVLHDGSFIDDPTRIFRAVRFEQRFNFKIDRYTLKLIRDAVSLKMPERIEKYRIKNEMLLILKEKEPIKTLSRLEELLK